MLRRLAFITTLITLWTVGAHADAPPLIPVQGTLVDSSGAAINDVFAVTFTLYSDAGSTSVWTEETPVNFVDGYFTAYLGATSTLDLATFRDNGTLYLGVKVADDEEMTPFELGSSPFAGFAQYAGFAADITDAAKVQIVADVAVQLDNDGKVHDKYTDAEAIAAVTDALANDATQLEAALGATDNANPLNHDRYTDAEAVAALTSHTSDPAAHHTRYSDAEADARASAAVATHTAVADAHHAKYTDAEADARVTSGINTHAAIVDAHHARYSDAEARGALTDQLTSINGGTLHFGGGVSGLPTDYTAGFASSDGADIFAGHDTGGETSTLFLVTRDNTNDSVFIGGSGSQCCSSLPWLGLRVFASGNASLSGTLASGVGQQYADLAENVPTDSNVEAGDVVVVKSDAGAYLDSAFARSSMAYDVGVVGVISDSATLNMAKAEGRQPLALSGLVKVKVDASHGAIRPGDLLVSSSTPGHAMRAHNAPAGTVIGKALEPLASGQGRVLMLVMPR